MVATDLQAELRPYGAPAKGVIPLDIEPDAAQVPYLDLCRRSQRGRAEPLAHAVVELDNHPVLYVLREDPGPEKLERIRQLLFLRGQADHLALLEPGQLHVFPLGVLSKPWTVDVDTPSATMTIPRLGLAAGPRDDLSRQLHVDLLDLLTRTIGGIVESVEIDRDAALSWVSRAVFFRFLIDREIVRSRHLGKICNAERLEDCFADPAGARATSAWLKSVFNGDLLPVDDRARSLRSQQWTRLCDALTNIMYKAEASGQLRLEWSTLDFGHLPVGILSQVYENYSHRFERDKAQRDSIHYTPRSLAEYVVAEALYEFPEASKARILDPACGAGVFLVASFRALVRARWEETGKRPERGDIRKILYQQITGFDVNETALRLSALSLYLTALELDPAPRPISQLRFENLRGYVLHDVSRRDRLHAAELPPIGSLGSHVSNEHRHLYDLVVGNPPWTTWQVNETAKSLVDALAEQRAEVEEVISGIVARRTLEVEASTDFVMVDKVPDIPMCWRALDWLRPGGRLALMVHARLLFKQTEQGLTARNHLFGSMRVSGILNVTALRETKLWPGIKAPFCILFGENIQPKPYDTFTFVSPYLENDLNRRGIMRVDPSDAKLVTHGELQANPTLLKTLFRGTELDLAVAEKLRRRGYPTLHDYWRHELGLSFEQGWRRGGATSRRSPAPELNGLPKLTPDSAPRDTCRVETTGLERFADEVLARARDEKIYHGPLVLLPKSPRKPDSQQPGVYFSRDSVAFNESFYGFSCDGHAEAEALAHYMLLVLSSDLVVYTILMTSSQFGVERDAYLLLDVLQTHVRPFGDLSDAERKAVRVLAQATLDGRADHHAINEFVFRCHGLNRADIQVVRDTLAVATPFAQAKKNSQSRPTPEQINAFVECLECKLRPFLRRRDVVVKVRFSADLSAPLSPWLFLELGREYDYATEAVREIMGNITDLANDHGASLVTYRHRESGMLIVALLARYRHWTLTRARLLAGEILRLHEDYLVGASA